MQAIRQLASLRQSAFAHSRTVAVCAYHSQLQQQMKWPPMYRTCQRSYSYSHQPKYHRYTLSSSNQLWNNHLIKTGGLLVVGQEPIGVRTKIEIISSDKNLSQFYIPSPTEFAYEYLEHLNESYPWWLTIAMVAVFFRTALILPFSVYQHRIFARLENSQVEINTQAEQLKQKSIATAKLQKWSQQQLEDYYGQELRYIVDDVHWNQRCSPRRLFYVVGAQMTLWSTFTVAIGQMTGKFPDLFMAEPDIDFLPELCTQGALWFSDLTEPSITLAILYGLVNLTLTELWSVRKGPLERTQHMGVYAFRGISVGMACVAACMPSAVTLYWLTSSMIGLVHFALLRIVGVRRLLDIAETPSEMKHPLTDTQKALIDKYTKKSKKYVA
ncbi:cytochrome c oxidase assembly protein COX18, mitochondrial-like [Amphiura filiformis]|uniref:cytochrome c oxidase assembly protein COX18, mitochondrial-like n=1 Tax=Amphiura filiformis TaxID=82378 RepID=UPI003B21346F